MKLVLAKWAADRVADGESPEKVAADAMTYLRTRVNGHGGIIVLDAKGRFGIAHNTPRMAWAFRTSAHEDCGITRSSHAG
jgi:beta-aspartyl-peptidase (threonine type)